ncbi:unnamed protein product [Parascedosporium putredinis]|uniref:Uncharacterized protein n=1 Tax=Parascedosporium putredinis TaxID=1442378 RepID=A0A9P1H030_9PEZI|nr:unnamed protein product [Parascedosporium putredinis]CAI7992391.1 unnamed protein product [Parascedosporium putredinis]
MPLIGHINASTHPIYDEPWLHNVADRILTYRTVEAASEENVRHIEELELARQKTGQPDREKHLLDYTLLLRQCDASGAPPSYGIRRMPRYRAAPTSMKAVMVTPILLAVLSSVAIYFSIGHLTMLSILRVPTARKRGGCCFQGILWPHKNIEPLANFYTEKRIGFVDSLAWDLVSTSEQPLGDEWTVLPAIMQHIGGKSSKETTLAPISRGDDRGRETMEFQLRVEQA